MAEGRLLDDGFAFHGASVVPPEIMTFAQGELLVSGTPIETDFIEQGIATILLAYPWTRLDAVALRGFMGELLSPEALLDIPPGVNIDQRVRQLAAKVNEAAGVERIATEHLTPNWSTLTEYELLPADEAERPIRSFLYRRFIYSSEIAQPSKGAPREQVPLIICGDKRAVFNSHRLQVDRFPLYLLNVLLHRRGVFSTSNQIMAFRDAVPGYSEPNFSKEMPRLDKRVNLPGEPELLVRRWQGRWLQYMLNDSLELSDLRDDPDAAEAAWRVALPPSHPAIGATRNPRRSRHPDADERRDINHIQMMRTYKVVVARAKAQRNVSDIEVETKVTDYTELDKETVRHALLVERIAERLRLPLRPGDIPGITTLPNHYEAVVDIFDKAVRANYRSFADNTSDRKWNLAAVGLYLGLPVEMSLLSHPTMQVLRRPPQKPTSYQELFANVSSATGGREPEYINRLCGLERSIDPALKKCIALVRLPVETTLRALRTQT